jgi:hypothetical protein
MHTLSAISALCFLALVLATVLVARHLRSRRASTVPQNDFAHYLFAAAADQDPGRSHAHEQQSMANKIDQTFGPQAIVRNQSTASKLF